MIKLRAIQASKPNDIQTAFINIYKLTHNTIKSIDENNLEILLKYNIN